MGLMDRIKHGWNAFRNNRDPTYVPADLGATYSRRPDRVVFTRGNERSIITAIFNKIALDFASLDIRHVRLDEEGRFIDYIKSDLDNCLTTEANIDQTGRALKQDMVMSMFDEGCIAIVPVDTDLDPETGSFKIETIRVGKIREWAPEHVKVRLYNEKTGDKEDVWVAKKIVAIVENPFYAVMNEPSSTMQRLIRKLNILDAIDEQSGAGKLDLIIQLPYSTRSETRRQQAETRRKDIEMQLAGSKYGIAYADASEKITQLNRPVDNNLMKQIEYLTSMLYSQLGITQSILDGTADEATMLNYYNRTIAPIVEAIVDEMKRKFLTKTARSQKQSIMYFRDPFKLVTVDKLAEAANAFIRNGIMTANEFRPIFGRKPSTDENADKLINSNIKQDDPGTKKSVEAQEPADDVTDKSNEGEEIQNGKEV
jgi:hypothetical protein